MSDNNKTVPKETSPGDGIRSLKTSTAFRLINFELYARPNVVIMGIGLVAIVGCASYIAYMKSKYEEQGFYSAVQADGTEQFTKRKSKWD